MILVQRNLTSETSKNENSLEIVSDENLNLNTYLLGRGGEQVPSPPPPSTIKVLQKVRTHIGGSSQMRTTAYERERGV